MPPISGLRRIVVADRLQRGHELRAAPPLGGTEPRDLNDGDRIERLRAGGATPNERQGYFCPTPLKCIRH
jgi:hypothetical protein